MDIDLLLLEPEMAASRYPLSQLAQACLVKLRYAPLAQGQQGRDLIESHALNIVKLQYRPITLLKVG